MKKYLFIRLTLLILLLTLSTNTNAYALELDYGLSYNNLVYYQYQAEKLNDDYFMREDLNEGLGLYAELKYPLNNFTLGAGIDKINADWTGRNEYVNDRYRDFEYAVRIVGPYLKVAYNLSSNFKINTNLAYYDYQESFQAEYSWQEEDLDVSLKNARGLGVLLGGEYHHQITNLLYLSNSFNFRYIALNIIENYDWYREEMKEVDNEQLIVRGLSLKLGINYRF